MAEKEYIERDAVNDLIKAECSPKVAAYLIDAVATVPAADVRPVVLCRDCKMQQYCKVAQYLGEDGFCSNGEKDVRSSGKCKLYKDCEYRALWNCCCEDCNMME